MARNADENDVVSVDTLLAELLPQAEGMRASVCYAKGIMTVRRSEDVPVNTRQEIVGLIRKLLERQIEFT